MDDLVLCLTRLTDPEKTGKKENLTIKRLPDLCEDLKLREQVQQLVEMAVELAEPARKYRNQQISHIERNPGAATVPWASLDHAQQALDGVHRIS